MCNIVLPELKQRKFINAKLASPFLQEIWFYKKKSLGFHFSYSPDSNNSS